jgi:hypothetical protein
MLRVAGARGGHAVTEPFVLTPRYPLASFARPFMYLDGELATETGEAAEQLVLRGVGM